MKGRRARRLASEAQQPAIIREPHGLGSPPVLPGRAAGGPAAPPQTRTSPIKAYGSSEERFGSANGRKRHSACDPRLKEGDPPPLLLSAAVLWTRLDDSVFITVFPSDGSAFRRPPWLLTGSLGMVRLLSNATMRPLRLPLPVSPGSWLSLSDPLLGPAVSLAQDTGSLAARRGVGVPVSPLAWLFSEGERRISQVPREPLRPFLAHLPASACPVRRRLGPALRSRSDLHARPVRRFGTAPA